MVLSLSNPLRPISSTTSERRGVRPKKDWQRLSSTALGALACFGPMCQGVPSEISAAPPSPGRPSSLLCWPVHHHRHIDFLIASYGESGSPLIGVKGTKRGKRSTR